ncbi:MAG TPA: 2-oxoacid:acceptor oxidoreductase subunit alpha [Actinomycetota bacterium]|nr:2-oxoacid:acceptor oxidoreductase subunit alpha [Actinomycetota bacterium]
MAAPKTVQEIDKVVIRLAGDSGDGMQVTGDRFTNATAVLGNDLATLPDFPAEIRAPAGTLFGVSGFQLHFADHDILTPGDSPNVLVAMNPAALKTNLGDLLPGGIVIANTDAFEDRNLAKAEYTSNPLTDGTLQDYQLFEVPLNKLTLGALEGIKGLSQKEALRSKNMFALGLLSWMFSRPVEGTEDWVSRKFGSRPEIAEANVKAFRAGYAFGETTEVFTHSYSIKPAKLAPGTYRNVTGNTALAYGLVAAGERSGVQVFLAGYPITPASDVLHELSRHKSFGIKTMQAEDEISAAGAALGASFGGSLGVTITSGPGLDLKAETISLGISVELPMLVFDIQRAGPSTGMPTKTEQADLMLAMYGRHGESPLPILAPRSPSDCFDIVLEAARIALKYRTPVIVLSDAFLATGAEPWKLPDVDELPDLSRVFEFTTASNHESGEFWPFLRDPVTLARPWAIPGTPGLEHRIGGLEKSDGRGDISYDPDNHDRMVRLRAAKIAGIARDIPAAEVTGDADADVLVLGWGSTYGPIRAACRRVRTKGHKVAQLHLRHLNPFPANLGDVLRSYSSVVIPEINLGQLLRLVRAEYLVDAHGYQKVTGAPFKAGELESVLLHHLGGAS